MRRDCDTPDLLPAPVGRVCLTWWRPEAEPLPEQHTTAGRAVLVQGCSGGRTAQLCDGLERAASGPCPSVCKVLVAFCDGPLW